MTDDLTTSAIPLDPGNAFEAVSNQRRRQVILSLDRTTEPIPAGDLAVQIAAIEHGIPPSDVSGDQRTTVYVTLTQNHLPRLDTLGIIAYDDRSKLAAPTDVVPSLAAFVRRIKTACYQPQEATNGTNE